MKTLEQKNRAVIALFLGLALFFLQCVCTVNLPVLAKEAEAVEDVSVSQVRRELGYAGDIQKSKEGSLFLVSFDSQSDYTSFCSNLYANAAYRVENISSENGVFYVTFARNAGAAEILPEMTGTKSPKTGDSFFGFLCAVCRSSFEEIVSFWEGAICRI